MNTEKWNKVFNNRKPLVNEFCLNYILNNVNNEFSFVMKSFFVFYYMVFTDRNMFIYISNCNNERECPWNENSNNRTLWIPNFIRDQTNLEERNKLIKLWFCLISKWYTILFCNSLFYISYSELDGYGIYARENIELDNEILNNNEFRHGTFMESITEIEYEVLRFCGLDTFIKINESKKTKSDMYILYGFWMFANSNYKNSRLFFATGYDFETENECDSKGRVGNHFRTIIQITEQWSEMKIINLTNVL